MDALAATKTVLEQAKEPLHYREITRRVLGQKLWTTGGKTPEATVNARLSVDIAKSGEASPFVRVGPGVFGLREWGLAETTRGKVDVKPEKKHRSRKRPPASKYGGMQLSGTPDIAPKGKTLSFTDAAERILHQLGKKQPMHYRAITEKALELGLIHTEGKTPEATMYAQILTEIQRRRKRGETPRFVQHGRGHVGLSKWMGRGLAFEVEQHNAKIRKRLLETLKKMPPEAFEVLISSLLVAIGFDDVEVTPRTRDGGIDVRGTLVVGDVIRTRMAVQAKRFKDNVQSPVVQQVRGSLGTHDQGLIITTSDFSPGARREADRSDAIPVALMNGEQLVKLLVENEIGVTRTPLNLIEFPPSQDTPERE